MWLIVIACAFIHIISIKTGPKWLFFLTKPLPIVAMIGMLLLSPSNHLPYTQWIIAGLSISLIGDLVMMHPKDKFILGIKLFCLALICYALGFINMAAWHFTPWLPFAVFGVGLCAYFFFKPDLGKEKWSVASYIFVLMAMLWMSLEYYASGKTQSSAFAVLGSFVFTLSGAVLAFERFGGTSIFSRQVVMTTYYSAQYLITMSVFAIVIRFL
ncbi:lysoplasmalogenase [Vibrio owensii]|uniref:lysoplasmalogenase n=1 Tax=Vibrio owensii TaxID=696485 RepID=UPI0003A97A01|nr:lysoplasmalogenase [Vibrio owensii]